MFRSVSTCLASAFGAVAPAFCSHCPHSAKPPTSSLHQMAPAPPCPSADPTRASSRRQEASTGPGVHALLVFISDHGTTIYPAARADTKLRLFSPPWLRQGWSHPSHSLASLQQAPLSPPLWASSSHREFRLHHHTRTDRHRNSDWSSSTVPDSIWSTLRGAENCTQIPLPAASVQRSPHKRRSPEQSPLLTPRSCLSLSNDRILPEESRSVPESTLLTSGTPAAPSPAELGHPSGLYCDLPRAPWAPSTAMRCPQRESSGFGCRREVHTCERKEEEDLVLECVGSEGPPCRDTVSRAALFRPHGGSREGAPSF